MQMKKSQEETPTFFLRVSVMQTEKGVVGWTLEFWFCLGLPKKPVGLRNYSQFHNRDQDPVQLQ